MNICNAEITTVKKMFTLDKLKSIDKMTNEVKNLSYKIEILKLQHENFAQRSDLDVINDSLQEYTPMRLYRDMKDDIKDFVPMDEFLVVQNDMQNITKDVGRYCTKDEMMTRLNVFNSDVNTKMHDRPTIAYFKKIL